MNNIFEELYDQFVDEFGINILDEEAVKKTKDLALELHSKLNNVTRRRCTGAGGVDRDAGVDRGAGVTDNTEHNNNKINLAKEMMITLQNLDLYEDTEKCVRVFHLLSILSCQCECRHLRLHPDDTNCHRLCCMRHSTISSSSFNKYKDYLTNTDRILY